MEDEEGYKKFIEQKKDKSFLLVSQTDEYINQLTDMVGQFKNDASRNLNKMRRARKKEESQTDKYINQLTDMVGQHKNDASINLNKMRKQEERALIPEHELRVYVNNNTIGVVMKGDDASLATTIQLHDLDYDFNAEAPPKHEKNDDDEVTRVRIEAKRADSEYKKGVKGDANYYNIARSITEEVRDQTSSMVNGNPMEYQVKGFESELIVSLYNNNLNGNLAVEMGLGNNTRPGESTLTSYPVMKCVASNSELAERPITRSLVEDFSSTGFWNLR